MNTKEKAPTWFWIVSVIALIWNLMGCMAYLTQKMMTPEMLEAMPEAERIAMENMPAWATAAFAFAVWGGAVGSIFLLLRKRIAFITFIISFIGILVQFCYNFFIANTMEIYGPGALAMPIMVILFGGYLIYLAKKAQNNNWIS